MFNDPARLPHDGRNLTSSIAQDLGRAIVTGHFAEPGFPVEADLCRQYQASRSVVREAVKMLTAKGLLAARPRQGTWVQTEARWNLLDPDVMRWLLEREFSIELLIDFTNVRIGIEPQAARLAAQSATPQQQQRIAAAIERMRAAERGEDDPLASDIAFHVAVLQASNNRFIHQFTELVETTLRFSIRRTNEYKGVPRASAGEHARVADAILAGNADLAASELHELIRRALDLLLAAGRRSRTDIGTG